MKPSGFTLIEILVALGIFGILTISGTALFVNVVQNTNRANIQNEVRQSASRVLSELAASIRTANCVKWDNAGGMATTVNLWTYSDNCVSDIIDTYQFTFNSGQVTKNGQRLTPNNIAFLSCGTTAAKCSSSCVNGLRLSSGATGNSVLVSLTAQNATNVTRSDFCAAVTLSVTLTPRSY